MLLLKNVLFLIRFATHETLIFIPIIKTYKKFQT
ncbi:Hypothetical protein HPV225_0936 [Helicobacter pylori v225d]|nr:Hypothetical protein HPV225_0936 [Helicobacter pylori v225d]